MWKSPLPASGGTARPDPGVDAGRRPGGLEYRPGSDHPKPVENTRALSSRRDMFLDERGTGLRVTWHPERDLVVLSVWQGNSCVGTFRMSVQDVPRLSGLLAAALGDWVDQTGLIPSAGGGPGTGRGPVPGGGPGPGGDPGVGGGPGRGGPGPGGDPGVGGGPAAAGDPGALGGWEGGGPRGGGLEGRDHGDSGSQSGMGGAGHGLSVQQRLRLSRPVLKLRGLQDRRRRPA
jgi:hypothetical protein